jgi:hypothetical protein
MKAAELASYDWVLDPPRETLNSPNLQTLPRSLFHAVWASALFSLALAKTFIEQPLQSFRPVVFVAPFLFNFCLSAIAFFAVLGLFYRVVEMVKEEPVPFSRWLGVGAVAMVPLHLALPSALICRSLGVTGLVLYSLAIAVLYLAVVRRWAWGVQALTGWSLWASVGLVISPLVVCGVFMVMLAVFLFIGVALMLLGIIA